MCGACEGTRLGIIGKLGKRTRESYAAPATVKTSPEPTYTSSQKIS